MRLMTLVYIVLNLYPSLCYRLLYRNVKLVKDDPPIIEGTFAIDRIFYGVPGPKNPHGMLGEHEKSL